MLLQLLPGLVGKFDELFAIFVAMQAFSQLSQHVHGGAIQRWLLRMLWRQIDLHVLLLGLSLNFSSKHFLEGFPLFSCLLQPFCLYLSDPAQHRHDDAC